MPQKYEREIDDILRRMGSSLPRDSWHRRLRRRVADRLSAKPPVVWREFSIVTPGRLMAYAIVLAALSFVLGALSPMLRGPAGLLALVLFIAAIVLSVIRSRRRGPRVWRGQPMDYSRRGPGEGLIWADWIRRWRDWRRRRRDEQRFR